MIHVLNNLHQEYDVILDGLKNCLKTSEDNALTIHVILKKVGHQYKKIKNKKEEKIEKEKDLSTYNKQYNQWCIKCGKYGHKPEVKKCHENKNEKEEKYKKSEKYDNKNRKFKGLCYHSGGKVHMSEDCWEQKYVTYKKIEKTEKAIDGDEDYVVLCLLTTENKKGNAKKFGSWKI